MDGRWTPTVRNPSLRDLGRCNSFAVQIHRNALHGIAFSVPFEDSANRSTLVGVDFKPHAPDSRSAIVVAFSCALNRHTPVTKNAPARVQPSQCTLFDTPNCFLRVALQ